MTNKRIWTCVLLTAALTVSLATSGVVLGKGKPKPPPPPTPTPSVSYNVTPVTMPATDPQSGYNGYYFNDHNESNEVVGWASGADGVLHAYAYLPSISSTQAYFLDHPALDIDLVEISTTEWYPRSAIGINSYGDFVGSLASTDPENQARMPFVVLNSQDPEIGRKGFVLGPCNTDAEAPPTKEFGADINDSGDVVCWSDGHLYVGNVSNPASFTKVDLAAFGLFNDGKVDQDDVQLSNRIGPYAILSGVGDDGEGDYWGDARLFRMFIDVSSGEGSDFELAPNYTDPETGIRNELYHSHHDMNDFGEVTGAAFAYVKKGKNERSSPFAGLWPSGVSEIIPLGSADPLAGDWTRAYLNNNDDFLLRGFDGNFLLHGDWGQENGPVDITEMIADDDRALLTGWAPLDITDREDEEGEWPVIIGRSDGEGAHQGLMILTPVAN